MAASFVAAPLITATRPTPPLAVAAWRLLLAAAALAPLGGGGLRRTGALRRPVERRLCLWAALALAAHFAFWVSSLRLTTIAAAATLASFTPLFGMPLEYVRFGQRPGARRVLAVLVALGGLVCIAAGGWRVGRRALEGDALALAGALAEAVYLVAGRAARASLGALPYNLAVFAGAGLALAGAAAATRAPLDGFPARVWLFLGLLAVVPTLLGHAMANYSLARLSATTVGLAYLLEPAGASFIGYLWLHQAPSAAEVAGAMVALGGLGLYLTAPSGA